MKKSAKHFFSAMGSILDLCPAGSYSEYHSNATDIDLINSDWVKVGSYVRDAVTDNEQKKIPKKASNRRPEKSC
ncbi:Uncharacterised protein [Escherichia coli]|nr:hypothetical protein [Escherichia coli]EIY6416423.1 hypothetical protein [Escherichia coli]EJT8708951.1 hypothetical protein [Escherichia coli]RDO50358.1 hypothetical protein C4A72_00917 [Escherichia coli]RDO54243.1 hypothetical protein C4A74_01050 [Escherichia coli]